MFVNGSGRMNNLYRGPSIDRIIWPSDFREEEFKKSANQIKESPVVAIFVNGSVRNEESL